MEKQKNTVDCFEWQTSGGEFIIVWIDCNFEPYNRGVFFSIEGLDDHNVFSFSGQVKKRNGSFFLPFDLEFGPDRIECYLQEVHSEIMEGYIIPNGIELID